MKKKKKKNFCTKDSLVISLMLALILLYFFHIVVAQYKTGNACTTDVNNGVYGYCQDNGMVNCGSPGDADYDLIAQFGCCPIGLACICDLTNPDASLRTVCNISIPNSGSSSSASQINYLDLF